MKNLIIFLLYFCLGFFLIFSFKKVNQILNSQQLKTPLAQSSFSLDVAPSESLRGTIVSLSGDVSWQSRAATEPVRITKPMQVQQGEEIRTLETGRATVVFSNIANIIIHPETKLNFIQTLPVNISIEQNSGTAEYMKLKDNPLSVRSLDLLIKINEGNIIVSVSDSQPYIIIDVKSGSVIVGYNDINYITRVLDVESGNRLIFKTDTKRASLVPLQ
jgi:hypothetical protein